MSSARSNCPASIERWSRYSTLPRAKLQKSQEALQELVTAILQRAGPPRRRSRSMSQVLAAAVFMPATPKRESLATIRDSQEVDAQRRRKDGLRSGRCSFCEGPFPGVPEG